jgi:hypothetical protein
VNEDQGVAVPAGPSAKAPEALNAPVPNATEPTAADRLAAIKARAEAASIGPWTDDGGTVSAPNRPPNVGPPFGLTEVVEWVMNDADRAFITHAREDVPWLVAQVERYRSALWHIQQLHDGAPLVAAQRIADKVMDDDALGTEAVTRSV